MKKLIKRHILMLCFGLWIPTIIIGQVKTEHNLVFNTLADRWDEAMPLGNGIMGALIWEKDGKLRIGLDRADLWDLRKTPEFESPDFNFEFVYDHVVNKKDIAPVRKLIDDPYSNDPGPSKIPAGAIEFNIKKLGEVKDVTLCLESATCFIEWKSGVKAQVYVHSGKPFGRIRFENLTEALSPEIDIPKYNGNGTNTDVGYGGLGLQKLAYDTGELIEKENIITWKQPGYGDFEYEISIAWENQRKGILDAVFAVTTTNTPYSSTETSEEVVLNSIKTKYKKEYKEHLKWWNNFWNLSEINLPDKVLEKQYYLEMYKFGSASRKEAPPITLQAIWTADDGGIPPWKGDFHNDLNTQLSYWPGYTANMLDETSVFTDWLWMLKPKFNAYTKKFYGIDGLNTPGINTLTGDQMGGWNQYSCGSTVSAWLGHHFYLQWKYSMDKVFLRDRAYPWIKDVALFFDNFSVKSDNGYRTLPLSSSPEVHDNSLEAWYTTTTNFDLALVKFTYTAAKEMALELGLKDEAKHYEKMLNEWPDYSLNPNDGSMAFAEGDYYAASHRHFSHMLAFHPLGILDESGSKRDQEIIRASVATLDKYGADYWTGYSYSWLGNMKARLFDGEGAAEALGIFAKAFVLKNSFHVNGDQTKSGYSKFTYRPFTLEGNFAFASGIQDMLLQSHTGTINVIPAIPSNWKNFSFTNLRTQGALLVSAEIKGGTVSNLEIKSEQGGDFMLKNPFLGKSIKVKGASISKEQLEKETIVISLKAGQRVVFRVQ